MSSFKRLTNTTGTETTAAPDRLLGADQFLGGRGLSRRSVLGSTLGIGVAGLGTLLLSACGFRPMYGDPAAAGSAGGATSAKLAQVEIDAIADRLGQQLNNLLRDRMNPTGQPDKPKYHLAVTLGKNSTTIATGDSNTRHQDLTVTANYWLSRADSGDTTTYLLSNINSRVTVNYDTLDDPYNDIATEQDAERRAIEQLADMITTRVSAYFSQNAG
jgi:LPS-assembly lipoprotein